MATPSYDAVHLALNHMLASLGIRTDDSAIRNESQNPLIWQSEAGTDDFVQRIDSMTDLLSSISSTIAKLIATRIANIRKCRNIVAPRVHHLPVEIFDLLIFNSLQPMWTLNCLAKFRTVCTLWAQRIRSNPQLWATITDYTRHWRNDKPMSKLIDFSGSFPLDISFCQKMSTEAVAAIIPHAYRLRRLTITTSPINGLSLLTQPMTALESLKLIESTGSESVDIENLLGGNAPRLQSLKTSYVIALSRANPVILTHLKDLTLFYEHDSLSIPALMKILASCHHLQSLRIVHPYRDTSETLPLETAPLPFLKKLHLEGSPLPSGTMLKGIDAPQCRSYSFKGERAVWEWEGERSSSRELLKLCLRVFEGVRGIAVTIDGGYNITIRPYPMVDLPTFAFVASYGSLPFLIRNIEGTLPTVLRIEAHRFRVANWDRCEELRSMMHRIEEVGIYSGPEKVPPYGPTLADLLRKVVLAQRPKPSSSSSSITPLRRLEVWEDDCWVDKLGEVMAELDLEDSGMVMD